MRGHDEQTHHMFSYLSPEQRVPADHPLRAVRALTDQALTRRFATPPVSGCCWPDVTTRARTASSWGCSRTKKRAART